MRHTCVMMTRHCNPLLSFNDHTYGTYLHCIVALERIAHLGEGIRETLNTDANGAMTKIRVLGLLDRVEVHIDHLYIQGKLGGFVAG